MLQFYQSNQWTIKKNNNKSIIFFTSSSSSKRTRFNATISPLRRFLALKTVPYVPVNVKIDKKAADQLFKSSVSSS